VHFRLSLLLLVQSLTTADLLFVVVTAVHLSPSSVLEIWSPESHPLCISDSYKSPDAASGFSPDTQKSSQQKIADLKSSSGIF
jgi:hypothetical protein